MKRVEKFLFTQMTIIMTDIIVMVTMITMEVGTTIMILMDTIIDITEIPTII